MGAPERVGDIFTSTCGYLSLSIWNTSERSLERACVFPSAYTQVFAAASTFGTLPFLISLMVSVDVKHHVYLVTWNTSGRVGAHMAFPEFVDTILDCSQALLLPTGPIGVVQIAGSKMRMEAAGCQEKPMDTLRASLSGTFLQRKDVVNHCLEFDL